MKIHELYSKFLKASTVTTDSRKVSENSLFVALKGENFNGNEFIEQAIQAGAVCALTDEKERENTEKNIFYVNDCLKTLQELAAYHRRTMGIPVISLSGSNGKTTTKELIAAVLSKKYKLTYTQGNLNNHIGVPMTLLSIKPKHELAVVEMGANHLREIEFLCSIAQPDFGYITNFGKAHLEGFGSEEGVIKGKSEMYKYLKDNDKSVFVNCNDSKQIALTQEMNRITFGHCEDADISFQYSKNSNGLCPSISYQTHTIQSQLIGDYNASNVAAAIAIGLYFKVPLKQISEAIEDYKSGENRSQIIQRENRSIVLDAYNANPSSMEAVLKNFEQIEGKQKVVILGDMFELGETSKSEHQRIADLAASLKFDLVFLIGEHFNQTKIVSDNIQVFSDRENAAIFFENQPLKFSHLLIKGSRRMELEKLTHLF